MYFTIFATLKKYFKEESKEIEQGNGIRGFGAIGKSHVAIMAESTVLENFKQYHFINLDIDEMEAFYLFFQQLHQFQSSSCRFYILKSQQKS